MKKLNNYSQLKKAILFTVISLITKLGYCQDTITTSMPIKEIKEKLADGYTISSGFTFKEGDTIKFGAGTLPDHRYAFIYQNPLSLDHISSDDKHYMTTNAARQGIIKQIFPYGNKKSGYTIIAKIGIGDAYIYWVELDAAARSGEVNTNVTSGIGNGLSKADELKKWKDLLDSGAITKEEYEAQKKKILEQ